MPPALVSRRVPSSAIAADPRVRTLRAAAETSCQVRPPSGVVWTTSTGRLGELELTTATATRSPYPTTSPGSVRAPVSRVSSHRPSRRTARVTSRRLRSYAVATSTPSGVTQPADNRPRGSGGGAYTVRSRGR